MIRIRFPRLFKKRSRRGPRQQPPWLRVLLWVTAASLLVTAGAVLYLYFSYARVIDARLHGERERTLPRVYARPVELRRGQPITEAERKFRWERAKEAS